MTLSEKTSTKSTSVQLFTGKGGVGKTTISTACALGCAQTYRTLLLSTDPAGSLGEIFGRDFTEQIIQVAHNLDVVELSRKTVLKLWREKFAADIFTVLSSFLPVKRDILDYIEGAPGIDEEFMLSYLLDVQQSGSYDIIIWDAAPTSTTLKLLELQKIFYSHLTDAQKIYLKFRGFFKDADPLQLIARWRRLTEEVIAMLRNNTSTWIVANPERLPVEQALLIASSLDDFGIKVNGYIMNKLLPEKACPGCEFFEKKFLAQKRWQKSLKDRVTLPILAIPELSGDLTDTGELLLTARKYGLADL
jgi:arsenite-transporting ATPase